MNLSSGKRLPLTETQVVAAGRIHNELEQWKAADRVLNYLGKTILENTDLDRVLLKAAALNQLYGTNVYGLYAMAQHIIEIFSSERTWDECSLVEQIAYLEASGRRHQSFASKYCHFFVDSEQFPLFDSYVPVVVRMHLGRGNYRCKTTDQTYRNFYEDLQTLRRSISFDPTRPIRHIATSMRICRPYDVPFHLIRRCGNWITTCGCEGSGKR